MLVKIQAVLERQDSSCVKDYFINPDYITNASFSEDERLSISMIDGTRYVICDPSQIENSARKSMEIQALYDQFQAVVQKQEDEEFDLWVDTYYSGVNFAEYPEDWQR